MKATRFVSGGVSALVIVTSVLACGGEPAQQPIDTSQAASAAAPATTTTATPPAAGAAAPAAATGKFIDVKMVGDAQGYRFVPDRITIQRGDQVRWTMVTGGPHNVTFWPDSIPSGAGTQLQANMPETIQPLEGPLLVTQNQTYTVSFARVPAGTYGYYCTPHLALGMKAKIEVK